MSLAGILAGGLMQLGGGSQNTLQQLRASEFQKLGQDLQNGNLSSAQADFAALTQNSTGASATNQTSLGQAFNALGQALQSGNLTAAQQDFNTVQQDLQQAGQRHFHHHHHGHGSGLLSELASADQANNSASQAFGSLGQALQAGNVSAAQQAYATIQQDLGLFAVAPLATSSSASSGSAPAPTGSLSVTA